MKTRSLFAIFSLCTLPLFAQEESVSSFDAVTLTYNFHPKFFLYAEGQMRGIADYSYPDYYELKGGLGYNLSPNHKPLIGVGRYVNYTSHALSKEEVRAWLQDIITFSSGRFKFENRLRAEQSWFYEPQKELSSKRNRFRYRLNVSVLLNSRKMVPGSLFANAYDEVFLVTPTHPAFSRNRVYAGLGYQIDANLGVAGGYLWQREFEAKGNTNRHFLYLALNITIDHQSHPSKTVEFPAAD